MTDEQPLTANEWVVLALVAEQPTHGWAIASHLARGGELGSLWSLSRPVVYHALDRLEREGAIRAAGVERGGRGPHRVVHEATPRGRKELRRWLAAPVEHVRDLRSLCVVKLVLTERAGIPPEPLLVGQRALLVPLVAWLEAQLDDADLGVPGEHVLRAHRLETASSALRFIDGLLDTFAQPGAGAGPPRQPVRRAAPVTSSSRSSGSGSRSAPGTP